MKTRKKQKTPIVMKTTVPSRDMGLAIARVLVEKELVACAQISSQIDSVYIWEGKVHTEPEFVVTLKTHRGLFKAVEEEITRIHTYDVPQIIALKVDSITRPYYDWLCSSTKDKYAKNS